MLKKIMVGLSALCALYFSAAASFSLYKWAHCDDRAWGRFTAWRIIEIDPSQFAIEADYTFSYKEKLYTGTERLAKPYLFNRPSAEKEIQRREAQRPVIFFNAKKPSDSALQRDFPLKRCFYALMALGILGYFFFLDRLYFKQCVKKA